MAPEVPNIRYSNYVELMLADRPIESVETSPSTGELPASSSLGDIKTDVFTESTSDASTPIDSVAEPAVRVVDLEGDAMDTQEEPSPDPTTSKEILSIPSLQHATSERCKAVPDCHTGSSHLRKVISQYFGRNKRETRSIPEEYWEKWCRKHYQRFRYRRTHIDTQRWPHLQVRLINEMINRLEDYGKVRGWTVTIRKTEEKKLRDPSYKRHVREDFLIQYTGKGKSFDYVRNFINIVLRECEENKENDLPHFQLLPDIDTYPTKQIEEAEHQLGICADDEDDIEETQHTDTVASSASPDLPKSAALSRRQRTVTNSKRKMDIKNILHNTSNDTSTPSSSFVAINSTPITLATMPLQG